MNKLGQILYLATSRLYFLRMINVLLSTQTNGEKMAARSEENAGVINISGYTVNMLQELGRESFGTVFKGHDEAKDVIAAKKVTIRGRNEQEKRIAITEVVKVHFMKENIRHDHVMKVYDVKRWNDSMWIMLEFCTFGDLNNFFAKFYHKVDTKKKLNIMEQIAKGIAFLHQNNIVHRDIKPGNILMKTQQDCIVAKLGDFGLSKFLDPDDLTSAMSSNVGTVAFKAPEFWDSKPNDRVRYIRNVDVYAAGLTFMAMLQATPDHSLVLKVEGSLESFETNMSVGYAAFSRILNRKSEIRIVDSKHDGPLVKKIKSIIEAMTYFLPEARLAATEVEERISLLAGEVGMNYLLSL